MLAMLCLAGRAGWAELALEHVSIRQDRYTIPTDQWQWAEAWSEIRQYFPRYFKSAGTLHMFVRNTGSDPIVISTLEFNSQPIADVTVRPDYAGPVIWYRSNPEILQPGEFGMIYVRLREVSDEPVALAIRPDSGQPITAQFNSGHKDTIRLGFVGFSQQIDRIYAYVNNWGQASVSLDKVYLDGRDVTAQSTITNPELADGPALVEIALSDALAAGSFYCLKVVARDGTTAMSQVRARDAKFYLGIVQGQTPVHDYYARFFNTLYRLHGSHPTAPDWWDVENEVAKLGFTITQPAPTEEAAIAGATVPPGRIIYNGHDEPDAHEPSGLEYMLRCGINAMPLVEVPMRFQRRLDPYHDTMSLLDRTYAPMNWLTYGELPDIVMNDCYTPTRWMGYDLQAIPNQVQAVIEATSPRPAHMMLWGCMNTGYPMRRSPTPQENDMSVHYTIGEGAKGLFYFLDWNSYPTVFEGGYYVGAPRTGMLWRQMGRANAEITRLSSLLAIGHPFQIATSDNDMLYARSLLCGQDNFVVVLVNRNHRIHGGDRFTKQPHIFPVEQAAVELAIPSWFDLKTAVQVTYDGCREVELQSASLTRTRRFHVEDLETSMVIVLSQNPNIADQLTVPAEQYQAMLNAEIPTYVTDNAPIPDTQTDSVITIEQAAIEEGSLTLDLDNADTIAFAQAIETVGQLRLEPGEWLGLFTDRDWHGEASIVFAVDSPVPLTQVSARLRSMTPNFAACANNVIGLSLDGTSWREDCSFKMEWNGGFANNEYLNTTIARQR